MIHRLHFPLFQSLALLFLLAIVAGCSSTAGTSTTGGSNATTSPLASPTATSTPGCSQLSGFGSATPLSKIPQSGVLTPAGTIGVAGSLIGGGTGQWYVKTYRLCSPNSDTTLPVDSGSYGKGIISLFNYLKLINWNGNSHFPADGIAPTGCSGAHCYLSADLTNFLAIDQVTDNGNHLITWRVRYALSPGSTNCDSSFNSGYLDPTGGAPVSGGQPPIPLPPLTLSGQGQGAAGNHYLPLCSTGTASSVMNYLMEAMPAFGWQSNGSTMAWKQTVGSNVWTVEFSGPTPGTPITTAQNWLEDTHPPMPA